MAKKTINQLEKELEQKRSQLDKLKAERGKLAEQLEEVDREIADLTGSKTGRKRGRKPGPKPGRKPGRKPKAKTAKKATRRTARRATGRPLAEYIKDVLADADGPMRIKDITAAVKESGYPTKSKDFYGFVAATLRDTSQFKKVSRGQYTLA